MLNETSLDTVCGALCYAMGVEPPKHAAAPNPLMKQYIDEKLGGKKADRIVMYNPDAVAQWLTEKYPEIVTEVNAATELAVPLRSPFRPVTPVCFATMYTGAQPEVHGIAEYKKPILEVDTIFDAMARAGKRCAIVALESCSIGTIFKNRDVDYYFESTDAALARTAQLILEDKHDLIVCYQGNYDYWQHYAGPESIRALGELKANSHAFATINELIRQNWQKHNTLLGFAMDHGCHYRPEPKPLKDGRFEYGTHWNECDEDMNIVHRYKIYPAGE